MNNRTEGSALDRFLRLFAEVRAGEAPTVLMLALNVFLLLTAYYIIKPVREALILAGGGAELKARSWAILDKGDFILKLLNAFIYPDRSFKTASEERLP